MSSVSQNSYPAWYRRAISNFLHKLYLRSLFCFVLSCFPPQFTLPGLTLAEGAPES